MNRGPYRRDGRGRFTFGRNRVAIGQMRAFKAGRKQSVARVRKLGLRLRVIERQTKERWAAQERSLASMRKAHGGSYSIRGR